MRWTGENRRKGRKREDEGMKERQSGVKKRKLVEPEGMTEDEGLKEGRKKEWKEGKTCRR